MGQTKKKLAGNQPTLGAWCLIGHPAVMEILAEEDFDWVGVDLEHTSIDYDTLYTMILAAKGTGTDVFCRLQGCDAEQAKRCLDAGADGIIVPSVNTVDQARRAVEMAKFPPEGIRGSSLARATGWGRDFQSYFAAHNDEVLVAVMLEHRDAVANVDEILSVEGIDATLIGPYDLSASMGLAGQLEHPDVLAARRTFLDASLRHGLAPGVHVVDIDPGRVAGAIEQGYRFIACGLDSLFLRYGARRMLEGRPADG